MRHRPCKTCPWRRSIATHEIPGGGLDDRKCQAIRKEQTLHVMACHNSPIENPHGCAPFMVNVGFSNIGIRLAAMRGVDHPSNYTTEGVEVYSTFEEMLDAHGVLNE